MSPLCLFLIPSHFVIPTSPLLSHEKLFVCFDRKLLSSWSLVSRGGEKINNHVKDKVSSKTRKILFDLLYQFFSFFSKMKKNKFYDTLIFKFNFSKHYKITNFILKLTQNARESERNLIKVHESNLILNWKKWLFN